MAFDINTNIASLQAQNYLRTNSDFQSKTINRVTSGLRIVNSGDDAAGLAIANSERSDEAVLTQGIRNANDGLSTLQTIDGGINNISGLLDRARTLATQSATGTMDDSHRAVLDSEFQNVLQEINRQAKAIGMTSGGQYAKDMSVFIGGGQSVSGDTNPASAKITNGSVDVNLSTSLLDTTSLGLGGNGVAGAVLSASNIQTAITANNTSFQFAGPGFDLQTVTVTTGVNAAKTAADVVNAINAGIAAAALTNAPLATANITASLDSSTGKLVFSGASAFSVQSNSSAGATALLGGVATAQSAGNSAATVTWGGALTSTEVLTFAWRNSDGTAAQQTVSLASTASATAAATAINTQSNMGGIYAVVNAAGNIQIGKGDGGQFTVHATQAAGAGAGLGVTDAGVVASATGVLGTSAAPSIATASAASTAVTALATAVSNLGTVQGTVGRSENQLGYAINLAQSQLTNMSAAESRIRDADLAAEAANLTKAQILMQAGTAALAQANAAPQVVLSLLKG